MNIVTDSDHLIIMVSDGFPTPPEGGHFYQLTQEQEDARLQAFATPNGGVRFDGTAFTLDPAPPPVILPASCTPLQFRLEIDALGLTEQVEAIVAAASRPAQLAFEYATSFESNNPVLLALAAMLDPPLNQTQVRSLIESASQRNLTL